MDYQFENLGPEKFQEFCQALMSKEHSFVQCFPVGQPDGGRDAIFYLDNNIPKSKNDFAVIQIKYVRNPQNIKDPHKWILDIMTEEAPKLEKLIPKGAKYYYLITNVKGTAHPDSGSIDKLQQILQDEFEIFGQCIWRDDLCRRVDNAWDLKWSYPEIMNGNDLIRLIIENGLNNDHYRRSNAIRTYVRTQYDIDQKVKFKQVELQNNLFDLFIDGPLEMKFSRDNYIQLSNFRQSLQFDQRYIDFEGNNILIGAAKLLLSEESYKAYPYVVIEGGPGQGKSTLSQFICQVHRVKLLHETEKIKKIIPDSYLTNATRVPFKIDLRDYATWLEGNDPYNTTDMNTKPENWNKSLESFLAAQISHFSGGTSFNVNDLQAVAKISSIMIVLDGLDEVANITIRKDIVHEVIKGVHRLKELSASLQVIITSRPTAFANSEGFPEDEFQYLKLVSLTDPLINEYTEKWLKAKRIFDREASDVKKILAEKLDQPHLRDLARNPMQLSILLSLIHTRGSSLPDKRTALYDSYVDLFFARESEKNVIVREYRDILIDIHRYLAWVLHSEVEEGLHKGSISSKRLQTLLSNYLENEGYELNLSKLLFTGVVERVVFLVSRVEGTYEFEVQPLREYFAARHLFETAPYSPPGAECSGTRPDRFDAISRNFYWLNVTRFFAGCYSKGELPSLIDRLQELIRERGMNNLSHPRVLASMLLSDWVFAQHPKSMKNAVNLILDGIGSRYVFNNEHTKRHSSNSLVLPQNCGKDQLIEECWRILKSFPARDYALEIIEILNANTKKEEKGKYWLVNLEKISFDNRERWIEYGFYLSVYNKFSNNELALICSLVKDNEEILLNYYIRSGKIDFIIMENKFESIIKEILKGSYISPFPRRKKGSVISILSQIFNYEIYSYVFRFPESNQFGNIVQKIMSTNFTESKYSDLVPSGTKIIEVFDNEIKKTIGEWRTTLAPWNNFIEASREEWGDQWVLYRLANIAAGIKSSNEKYKEYNVLFDHSKPLCYRVRHARLRHSSYTWWKEQLGSVTDENDLMLFTLVFMTWASVSTQNAMSKIINEKLDGLSVESWVKIVTTAKATLEIVEYSKNNINLNELPDVLPYRTVVSIGLKTSDKIVTALYFKYLKNYSGDDPVVLSFCQRTAVNILYSGSDEWEFALSVVQKNYLNPLNNLYDIFKDRIYYGGNEENKMLLITAEKILETPANFPRSLVILAENRCRQDYLNKIVPVGEVALKEGWFPIYESLKSL